MWSARLGFATSDNEGNIDSLASDAYVTKAHQAGVEVWGLCNDFSPKMKIGKVLERTSRRQKLAKNLIAEAIRYSLDGINIDFENVKKRFRRRFYTVYPRNKYYVPQQWHCSFR